MRLGGIKMAFVDVYSNNIRRKKEEIARLKK